MDDRIRQLERQAASGDIEAVKKLSDLRRRIGDLPPLPKVLTKAKIRRSKSRDHILRKNRNVLRLNAHRRGTCGKNCKFCRKYGS